MSDTKQHPTEDRCYFCATDEELARGLVGRERRTIHMDGGPEACPTTDPADFRPAS